MDCSVKETRLSLLPLNQLPERYGLTFTEVGERLKSLQLEPKLLDKRAYLDPLQLELLDKLDLHIRDGKSLQGFLSPLQDAYLYQCQNCGDLKLSVFPLHREGLLHACGRKRWRVLTQYSGELELIATGPYDRLLMWAHSKSNGWDNSMKGI